MPRDYRSRAISQTQAYWTSLEINANNMASFKVWTTEERQVRCPRYTFTIIIINCILVLCLAFRSLSPISTGTCMSADYEIGIYARTAKHYYYLLSSSSSLSSSRSSSLCWVFIITYLKQTMCVGYTVLQLFCIYSLCYSYVVLHDKHVLYFFRVLSE